jgi:hypothetical protein
MRAFTGHWGLLRAQAPTFAVLAMVTAVLCLAWGGWLPGPGSAGGTDQEKDALLSYLPDVNSVSYARNVLYLYSDETPLMVVWVEDDPAELYGADGHFVASLTFQELTRVIRRASALLEDDPRWPTSRQRARVPGRTV